MRVLAVDPGSVRVGLALSDEDGRVAVPLTTLHRSEGGDLAARVAEVARLEGAEVIVMGLPLRMDGSEGGAARRARSFAEAVREHSGLSVVLWDERLSTVAAERALREAGQAGRRAKGVVDQAAATLLLSSYLDAHAGGEDQAGEPVWGEVESEEAHRAEGARATPRRRGRGRRRH